MFEAGSTPMENYIVRIYSRDSDDPYKVTATLESVEAETRQAFDSIHALPALLCAAGADAGRPLHGTPPVKKNRDTLSIKTVPAMRRRPVKEQ
jgi:hypothetical protein